MSNAFICWPNMNDTCFLKDLIGDILPVTQIRNLFLFNNPFFAVFEAVQRAAERKTQKEDDKMIYITGDTHGDFHRIEQFCEKVQPTSDDVLVILGDAGFNYFLDWRDQHMKKKIAKLPITVFSIHGNHEKRQETIPSYYSREWHGGYDMGGR